MAGPDAAIREGDKADPAQRSVGGVDLTKIETPKVLPDGDLARSFDSASHPNQFKSFSTSLSAALTDTYLKSPAGQDPLKSVVSQISKLDKLMADGHGLYPVLKADNTLSVKGIVAVNEKIYNILPEDKRLALQDASGKFIYAEVKSDTVLPLDQLEKQKSAAVSDAAGKPGDAPAWGVQRDKDDAKTPISPYVWAGFQEAVESKFGKGIIPGSEPARELIERAKGLGLELKDLPPGLFDYIAGQGEEGRKLVQGLMDRHQIPLKVPDAGPDAVHGGSVLDFNVTWKFPKTAVEINGQTYKAFSKTDANVMMVGDTPVVEVYRDKETGLALYMAKQTEALPGLTPYDRALQLTPGKRDMPAPFYAGAILPNVDYEDKGKVPQLEGTVMAGGRQFEFQSFTKIHIDADGALIKQGLQGTGLRSVSKGPYTLDGPALVWLSHPKASRPLFAFRADETNFERKKD